MSAFRIFVLLSVCAALCCWLRPAAAEQTPAWDDQPGATSDDRGPSKPRPKPPLDRPGMEPQPGKQPPRFPDDRGPGPYGPQGMPGGEGNRMQPGGPPFFGGDRQLPPGTPNMGPQRLPSGPPRFFFGGRDPRYFDEMKRTDPEMYELEKTDMDLDQQTAELAHQIRRSPPEQREALKKQLGEQVTKQFTVRQSRRELHLKRLQSELEDLKRAIERRNAARDQIVSKRIAELTGSEGELDF